MLRRLVYNKKSFKILNEYSIKSSNSDVSFSDIAIDFSGCSLIDIPFKYQEITIREATNEEEVLDGKIIFTGFLDDINLSEMKNKDEDRSLTLTLLSPLAMATKRYTSLIGTNQKTIAIKRILQPLIDDGFKIAELNIEDGQITTNFALDTVENCMNNICHKLNFFWFIDENKNIFINSIDFLLQSTPKLNITPGENTNNIYRIQPKIENVDYANVINFKNVRLFYEAQTSLYQPQYNLDYPLLNLPKIVKKGDTVQFLNPIVIDEETLRKIDNEENITATKGNADALYIMAGVKSFSCKIDALTKEYSISNNISFNDDNGEEKELVLQRDSFFKNLITGFKYTGEENLEIEQISSVTALRYTTLRFMYSNEINNLKGIISKTGIIEKTVDYQEKWTTTNELIEYARNLMGENKKTINQVEISSDADLKIKVGDLVQINEPDFYINGRFAVKEIEYKYKNEIDQDWKIILKNSDLNSSFIDLFRATQTQEESSRLDTIMISEYVEERVQEVHSLEVIDEG